MVSSGIAEVSTVILLCSCGSVPSYQTAIHRQSSGLVGERRWLILG